MISKEVLSNIPLVGHWKWLWLTFVRLMSWYGQWVLVLYKFLAWFATLLRISPNLPIYLKAKSLIYWCHIYTYIGLNHIGFTSINFN